MRACHEAYIDSNGFIFLLAGVENFHMKQPYVSIFYLSFLHWINILRLVWSNPIHSPSLYSSWTVLQQCQYPITFTISLNIRFPSSSSFKKHFLFRFSFFPFLFLIFYFTFQCALRRHPFPSIALNSFVPFNCSMIAKFLENFKLSNLDLQEFLR